MKIDYYYPLEKILTIKNDISDIKYNELDKFLKLYSKIYIKTHDNYTKKHYDRNSWRKKVKYNTNDFEKYFKNKWTPNLPKNDEDKIRKLVLTQLNKLNEKKFKIITKEFIDSLENITYIESYSIIISEIIKKIHSDSKYLKIYAKLIRELSINKKWQHNIISLSNTSDGIFWTINSLKENNNKIFDGPYESNEHAYIEALKEHSFSNKFIEEFNSLFLNRNKFIIEINKNMDSFELLAFSRNRYLNIFEVIYLLININYFKEDIILYCLLQFLNNFEKNNYFEELNAFCFLYKLYRNKNNIKISNDNHLYFEKKINDIIVNKNIDIKYKFKLEEIFNNISVNLESSSKKIIEVNKDDIEVLENIRCLIVEYILNENIEGLNEIFVFIPENKYIILIDEIFSKILDSNIDEFKIIVDLINILVTKNNIIELLINKFIKNINDYDNIIIDYPNMSVYIRNLLLNFKERNENIYNDLNTKILKLEKSDSLELFKNDIISKI